MSLKKYVVLRLFGVISLGLIVAGCVHTSSTYFKPFAQNAKYSPTRGRAKQLILSGPEGIKILVESFTFKELNDFARLEQICGIPSELGETGIGFSVELSIPNKLMIPVRFASRLFVFTDEMSKTIHEYKAKYVCTPPYLITGRYRFAYGGVGVALPSRCRNIIPKACQIDFLASLPVSTDHLYHPPTSAPPYYLYNVVLSFEGVQAKKFKLQIPPVIVGPKVFEFPVIDFNEVTEWFWDPINM